MLLQHRAHLIQRCCHSLISIRPPRRNMSFGISASSVGASAITEVKNDVAWRPAVPVGHSTYTWTGSSGGKHATTSKTHQERPAKHFPAAGDAARIPAAAEVPATSSSAPSAPAASKSQKPLKKDTPAPTAAVEKSHASKASKPQTAASKQPKATASSASPSAASASSSASNVRPSVLSHPQFASVRLTDIGANLSDDMFQGGYHGKSKHAPDLEQVLERAKSRGVDRIIVTAGSAPESGHVLDLVAKLQAADPEQKRFPQLFSTVGVHPTRSKQWNGSPAHQEAYFRQLLTAIDRGMAHSPPTVVAVGECGLDYDRLHFSDKQSQNAHFAKHFDLLEAVHAKYGVHLPLFLHDRNTAGDFAAVMKKNRARFVHGVVHSFTGTIEELKAHLELGLYIGINGCSLKTEENLAALHHIPLDRLLLETDAPWCDVKNTHASAPLVSPASRLPVAGKPENFQAGLGVKGRNEPGNMIHVLEVVAAHLGVDPIELAAIVEENTRKVFFPNEKTKTADAAASAASSS